MNGGGGKGANVAVSSARMLGRDKVVLFGASGSDLVANEHLEILRKDGDAFIGTFRQIQP